MIPTDFTLDRIRQKDLLLFETISGSRSFGTHHAQSDTDLRGIFVAPASFLLGLETIDQVSDEKSDQTYYEVGRFISLLLANNPNIVEMLFSPLNCIRHQHQAFSLIRPEDFLSQLCAKTFGNYAMGQIRKARGLNKKIVNPEPEQRHHLRHFCRILTGQGTTPLADWLREKSLLESDCSLSALQHAPGTYALYHLPAGRGLFSPKDDAALLCSSIPKALAPLAYLTCNLDAFKAHCRNHREYWQWVEKRNHDRYQTNTNHGRGYDSKNLMHTLRLLDQAIEIAERGTITLPRPNAKWLKKVKSGYYIYEDLLKIADEKHLEMEAAYQSSPLPPTPSKSGANHLLLTIRDQFSKR